MQKLTVTVDQLRPALTDALERLVQKELERRGFVIVDHPRSGRYLQFCTEPDTGILLFDEGGVMDVPKTEFELKHMPDVRCGVITAEMLIRSLKGWSLPGDSVLTITEDDGEGRWRGFVRKLRERIISIGDALWDPELA